MPVQWTENADQRQEPEADGNNEHDDDDSPKRLGDSGQDVGAKQPPDEGQDQENYDDLNDGHVRSLSELGAKFLKSPTDDTGN